MYVPCLIDYFFLGRCLLNVHTVDFTFSNQFIISMAGLAMNQCRTYDSIADPFCLWEKDRRATQWWADQRWQADGPPPAHRLQKCPEGNLPYFVILSHFFIHQFNFCLQQRVHLVTNISLGMNSERLVPSLSVLFMVHAWVWVLRQSSTGVLMGFNLYLIASICRCKVCTPNSANIQQTSWKISLPREIMRPLSWSVSLWRKE